MIPSVALRLSAICELDYETAILSVKLNKKRLVVCLEERIFIYDMGNMKLLNTINTNPNPNALCCLSPSSENCYLAYLPSTPGDVLIFDTINLQAVKIIEAHKNNVCCLAFSFDGTMIATASDKGTVVRVFSIPNGEKLFQFRRGTYNARIFSINFSQNNKFLCVSSDTDTVHVYKLDKQDNQGNQSNSNYGMESRIFEERGAERKLTLYEQIKSPITSATTSFGAMFLPTSVTEIFDPQRDFMFAKIPIKKRKDSRNSQTSYSQSPQTQNSSSNGNAISRKNSSNSKLKLVQKNICAITENNLLSVATFDGHFFQFYLDNVNGGELQLKMEVDLLEEEIFN
ncbi:autophagy protein [Clydaea vesicula]|uniref:Autophagy protein n=1 Tax=Clydaea vesicula TaxID=447962 RepID=A0AAD5XYW9_9FUNG|nr:autophagy protein [Clydaea vesicula]